MTSDNATAARPGFRFPRAGTAGPRLRSFWSWWSGALGSWLPLRLRTAFGLARQRLLLTHQDGELQFALATPLQDGEEQLRELGRLPWDADAIADDPFARLLNARLDGVPRWLLLHGRTGLRRKMILPAAAAERLRDVLAFEIDRQTPFTAEEVYYDARALARRADGQIEAELVVVPRARLEAAMMALGAPLSSTLAGVDMADDDGRASRVNLLPGAQRRQRRDPAAGWNLALLVIALVALAAGLWQVRQNRIRAADIFEADAKRRTQQARGVAAERRELVDLVEGLRFLQETRAGRPAMVEVLEELSRRLPDNTHLDKVSIEGERLLIIGLSPEAPQLIERLQGSKLWHSMTLTGALQPDPTSGKDRFTLTADITIAKSTQPKPSRDANRTGDADARSGL